jgi:hypothetical protein
VTTNERWERDRDGIGRREQEEKANDLPFIFLRFFDLFVDKS